MNVGFGEEGVVEFECCFEGFGVFLVNGGGWWVSKVRVCVSLFFFFVFSCFLLLLAFSLPFPTIIYHLHHKQQQQTLTSRFCKNRTVSNVF